MRQEQEQAKRGRANELDALADEAYIWGYPLLLMALTARSGTNVAVPGLFQAPRNQFARMDVLPDDKFTFVVMPNVDTLYNSAFLDLSEDALVLHLPDTLDRYYLMPMLDAYTNVFASPGMRTTGTAERDFAIAGPNWQGSLPSGVIRIDAPTNLVWIIGRTQINGEEDLPVVSALTRQYSLAPLGSYGKRYTPPPANPIDSTLDMSTPAPKVIAAMTGPEFFARLAALMKEFPPPERDRPALARFAKLGLAPGSFAPTAEVLPALKGVPERALPRIRARFAELGRIANGWRLDTTLGSYGTRYLDRATVALTALGANLAEDAVYASAQSDAQGQKLSGDNRYLMHFAEEPPVNGFWSLTMYSMDGYLVANPIQRFAIGNRDALIRKPDGSFDLLISSDAVDGNWLPAPTGDFQLLLRTYWPGRPIIDEKWEPPPIQKLGARMKH